jgi:transcriptional regulator with XRE-family HTH domain
MMEETRGAPREYRAYRPIPALKKWMDAHDLRQGELGKMLGVTGAQVSRWLSGRRGVPASVAIKLSDLTGIPIEQLSNRPETSRLLKQLGKRVNSRSKTLRNNDEVA